ncbi:hypothetical protein BDZ89DRAFT_1079483 [Hymenopellis radicata]|nr:hypothetical protein BDZ89DRAFT_1079483 [Hymenopellis radicata]
MKGPSQGPKSASIGYEKYIVQRMGIKMKFQLLATSLILAVTSPFALPMLLLKIRHFDEGLTASFDTIISAAYLMTIGTVLTLAHARSLLSTYDQKIHTQPSVTNYVFSGVNNVKGSYISGVSKASGYMNGACVTTFGAGVSSLLFHFYPTGTVALGAIVAATILVDSIVSQIKQGTLLKSNTLSAVSNLRGAVSENKLGAMVPAL